MRSERFDVVVLGAGVAGEAAIAPLARAGVRVALVERELIGGECSYWACIPSKTLLRPPEAQHESRRSPGASTPELDWERAAAYRDWMIRNLDDSKQVARYEKRGVTVVKASGRIAGPGRVDVDGRLLEGDAIIVATGSEAIIPPIDGLAEAGYWTNREATTLKQVPRSAVVIGGGSSGIEIGQMLARFGSPVTIVDLEQRLIPREEPEASALIADALAEDGIEIRVGRRAERVRRECGEAVVTLEGGEELRGEVVIVAGGRRPRTEEIGLETVGIERRPEGIAIDERCRVADGVWAAGDVTAVALFTHVGKYQARVAASDILGKPGKTDYRAIPRVVFCDPEVAAVGLTEAQAREREIDVATATVDLPTAIARPYTYEEEPRGKLGIVVDRERQVLLGAWAVAPLAGEWIHYATLAIKAEVPLGVLADTIAQFPTYCEGYLSALRALPEEVKPA